MFSTKANRMLIATCAVILIGLASEAGASQKVYSPIVEEGELAIEYRGHQDFDSDASKKGARKMKVEFEYGVTDRWRAGIVGEWERDNNNDALHYSATAWENIFQLFPKGKNWLDAGIYVEYEAPSDPASADKVELKLLLEKSVQRWTHTANLILEKEIGANAGTGTEYGYAWGSRWRWKPALEFGIEGHGSFGPVSHTPGFSDQPHQWGPVAYGTLPIGTGGDKTRYQLGYLVGLTDATANGSLKWLLEYETHF